MPGRWTMSMMWTRMPGKTWLASATSFQLMWLTMMVAMMLPSALPTFIKTRRPCIALCSMASGYFAIWLAAGLGVYALGIAFAKIAMQSETFSKNVPWLLGVSLVAAGATQFTNWKMTHLLRCRSQSGCSDTCLPSAGNFRLGCKQGLACCLCCLAPMVGMIALGMMNPLVMIAAAIAIALEKLLPRPVLAVRFIGLSSILAGMISLGLAWLRST
jgi:predicted metal-binding membrane protein